MHLACIKFWSEEWLRDNLTLEDCVHVQHFIPCTCTMQVAEHICLILLDELLFQQLLEVAVTGSVRKTSEALAGSILNGKPVRYA